LLGCGHPGASVVCDAELFGVWLDLNWIGTAGGTYVPCFTFFLFWGLGPLYFSKFYAPICLLFLGVSAWLFFRQKRWHPAVCVIGSLAAMLNKINAERHGHILTIEDPIEYIHPHKNCLVNQREVHSDTNSFTNALRAALREDPDIVLIGEMRDLETVESALKIAETGHLTFGTLHTNSAAQTINRIIDIFPSGQQSQIRTQLSLVLEGIVCQALLPRADGKGRVVSLEILVPNPAIRNLIRDDKIHQIYGAMQTGQEKLGMQTANQSLASLHLKRLITLEVALGASSNKDELQDMITRGVGVVAGAGMGRTQGTVPTRG